MRKFLALLSSLLLVFVLSGCQQHSHTEDQYFTASIGTWKSCPLGDQQTRECQYVEVPLSTNSTEKIHIAVAKVPAQKSENKKGTLVLIPGGPNASGLSLGAGIHAYVPQEISDSYDIISYDRRGVGRSESMKCEEQPSIIDTINQFSSTAEITDYPSMSLAIKDYIPKCTTATKQLYTHNGSKAEAKDLEVIRQVVNAEKLNILSYSYGTLTAQMYVHQYAKHAGKVIMDSTFDPEVSGAEFAMKYDPALGFFNSFDDGIPSPKLSDVIAGNAEALKESEDFLPVNQAYVCKDFTWPSDLVQLAKQLTEQNAQEVGQAMDPLKYYAVCSQLQRSEAVLGPLSREEAGQAPLVIASTKDKRATFEEAKKVAQRMKAYLYEVPGNRHIITGFGKPCAADAAKKYLLEDQFNPNQCS